MVDTRLVFTGNSRLENPISQDSYFDLTTSLTLNFPMYCVLNLLQNLSRPVTDIRYWVHTRLVILAAVDVNLLIQSSRLGRE